MTKTKKWSEQSLVERTFKAHDENGNEIETQSNVLIVCNSGMELYRKEFMQGKFKKKNKLFVTYDFIVLAGAECPKGEFYTLEYTIGEKGMVYHALIQAVDAVADIPMILGTLKRKNLLPEGFTAHKAWWAEDIDLVHICGCFSDEEGPVISGGMYESKVDVTSVVEYTKKYQSACLEYYRGDCREVWTDKEDNFEPVFVCGGRNVNDSAFDYQREADMEELKDLMSQAMTIVQDYNLHHFVVVETGDKGENGLPISMVSYNINRKSMEKIMDSVYAQPTIR